ncbi:MAG: hypothetical protein H0T62_11510 [Parachlamydiaceae bacterium]|nr:hypothetical protein [Parachlamydiaceae bacterium]
MPIYTNKNMRPSNLPLDGTFTPQKGREIWKYEENVSPSVQDPVFQKQREEKEKKIQEQLDSGQITKSAANREHKTSLQIHLTTAEEVAVSTNRVARLQLSRQAITDHIDQRISAFLIQLIDCYDTNYHFTIGRTETQTKSSPAVAFNLPQGIQLPVGGTTTIDLEATHQGTLPCIFSYDRAAWFHWKAQGDPNAAGKPAPIVYHKMADPYLANNACAGLDRVINNPADISLDGNATESQVEFGRQKPDNQKKLREISIGLLNRVALKEITPVEGFILYMIQLEQRVNLLADSIQDPDEKAVFVAWKQDLEDLRTQYQGDFKLLIPRLLRIHIPNGDRDTINLDLLVFPRHFKLLQRKYLYQSHLAAKIDILKTTICALDRRKRKNFDSALKLELIAHSLKCDDNVKLMFQRFFNCSGTGHHNLEQECLKTSAPALKLVRSPEAQQQIERFFLDFTKHVKDMCIEESHFKSGLLKEIRVARGLSLRAFADAYNEKYPTAHPLNHQQYRRMENGCVAVTKKQVKQFADILSIPKQLFSPGLLT